MTVTLAKVAGVQEIVACTPSDTQGNVNPYILFALEMAGATEIYRVGGGQGGKIRYLGCFFAKLTLAKMLIAAMPAKKVFLAGRGRW